MPDEHTIHTLGDHLIQFAQTVGAISMEGYHGILDRVQHHMEENLSATFFAVVIQKIAQSQPWLVGEWPERRWWAEPLKNDKGVYGCQAALAYATGKRLWIVGKNHAELHRAESYEDLLANVPSSEIPRYAQIGDVVSRTSIILPLRVHPEAEHFGVMNVESVDYLEYMTSWLLELEKIAKTIAILHWLKDTYILQTRSVLEARRRLELAEFIPVVRRRRMFLAASSRADRKVVGVLREVLTREAGGRYDLVPWTEPRPGSIHEKIWESLSTCTFGTCYFSEPAEEGSTYSFRDDPNVLFEAGVLYALRRSRRSSVRALLLVRESNASSIPFDLSGERMLIVPRVGSGELNEDDFRDQLAEHLKLMLESA